MIDFDKRLELIYGILFCVNKDLNNNLHNGLFVDEMPTYCNEFYDIYKKGISEEFLDYIKEYGINGNWNQPAYIALSLDENYNIIENNELNNNVLLKNNIFDKEKTEYLIKQFVKKSNYEEFYNKHSLFYKKIIDGYKESMSKYNVFDEKFIQEFYGYQLGNMSIKLYNFTTGSMGILIGDNQYYIQRVDNIGINENEFKFKPKPLVLIHEFSHPYIGPLVEKYLSSYDFSQFYNEIRNNEYSKNYEILSDKKSYGIFNEYLVRAVTIYLGNRFESKIKLEQEIQNQEKYGFIYIRDMISLFENKNKYDNFEDFFKNVIVEYCKKYANDIKTME